MSIYKAYDIRGLYPGELDEATARAIGRAFQAELSAKRVVVGRDMRDSSPGLARAAIEGLREGGADVVDVGRIATPMIYYAVATLAADGGLMVTASHNPARYNGLKLCGKGASPISYEDGIGAIEERVRKGPGASASRAGTLQTADVAEGYLSHVAGFLPGCLPLRLAVDGGNGMGGPFATRFLARYPQVRLTGLYLEPDGAFPNHEANPLKPSNLSDLQRAVREGPCDLGVAFDGDADRCVFVDGDAGIVPTDFVTALLARERLAARKGPVVYDLRSSWIVAEEIRAAGGEPVRNRVGHSFMKRTMRARDAVFGGELSGHYYFRENFFCDDGLVAMAAMLDLLTRRKARLADLVRPLRRYAATGEINFHVADGDAALAALAAAFPGGRSDRLDGLTVELDGWWFNARRSNTEPVLRLNLEARTPAMRDERLASVVRILGTPEPA